MIHLIPLIIGLLLIGFWLWMLVDLSNNKYLPRNTKNYWFLAFVFLNIFGAFWYYMVEYRPRNL
jgi:hypothetical protein